MANKTITVKVTRLIPGEYVTSGETYTIRDPASLSKFTDVRFWREEAQCGSYVQASKVRRAIADGSLVVI